MTILDGKRIKEEKLIDIKKEIDSLDRRPGIAVIQVGNNEASNVYIKNKENTAKKLGCEFTHIKFKEDVTEDEILTKIDELNDDKKHEGSMAERLLAKRKQTKNHYFK